MYQLDRNTMLLLSIWFMFSSCLWEVTSRSCGVDNSPVSHIFKGSARIEDYPWLGFLYYPYNIHKFTTAVVLVTKQIVLAAATEIDKLPKEDFRDRARVIIGYNCSGPRVGVRDYAYHPDYSEDTYSTLAIIQLEVDHVKIELRPICPPPRYFKEQNFYAMVLSDNCKRSKVKIYEMKYVSPEHCKSFYRRTGLDVDTLWPSHTACARSQSGGRCVWRSGAILVVKVDKRWRLVGFGVYGPGCEAPARFLDYGMYHEWVHRSVARIGRPAITNLDDNYVVLRRTFARLQRFGPCDNYETSKEIYVEETEVETSPKTTTYRRRLLHNLTIISDVEYSCVILRAEYKKCSGATSTKPKMRLRRWCAGGGSLCFGFGFLEMHFYMEITASETINLKIQAYGNDVQFISPKSMNFYLNSFRKYPVVPTFDEAKEMAGMMKKEDNYVWRQNQTDNSTTSG